MMYACFLVIFYVHHLFFEINHDLFFFVKRIKDEKIR